MTYASFWRRLGAYLADVVALVPLVVISIWCGNISRAAYMGYMVLAFAFGLWFHVYLVKRYGGTPGKLLVGIRIVKCDGSPVDYRNALLRYSVLLILTVVTSVATVLAILSMAEAEWLSLVWQMRAVRMAQLTPEWSAWASVLINIWVWGEFVVMLTNRKRRALHDFIAGTVVVKYAPSREVVGQSGDSGREAEASV